MDSLLDKQLRVNDIDFINRKSRRHNRYNKYPGHYILVGSASVNLGPLAQ